MHPHSRFNWAIWALAAAAIIGFAFIYAHPAKAGGPVMGAAIEVSAGGAITQDQLSSGTSKIDLSQVGLLGGIGAGLTCKTDAFICGIMGRYSYMHESGAIGSASLVSSNLVEVAAKFGVRLTAATSLYGLGGYAWQNLDLSSVGMGTKTPAGWLAGGGFEHQIAKSPWYLNAEYEHIFFGAQGLDASTKLTPDANIVRVGLAYHFGEKSGANPFDVSGLLPEEKGCDPKLATCPRLK